MENQVTATVRYVANGYVITSFGQTVIPTTLYAATIPEVVFWLNKLYEPFTS